MESEEARQGGTRYDRTSQHEVHQRSTHKRHARGDGSPDAKAPVGVLIPAKHLAREGHAERHQEKKNSQHPGELARIFVTTK